MPSGGASAESFLSEEFPLHAAVYASAPKEVLTALIARLGVEALKTPDAEARLPIHCAVIPFDVAELEARTLGMTHLRTGFVGRDNAEAVRCFLSYDPSCGMQTWALPERRDPRCTQLQRKVSFILVDSPFIHVACLFGASAVLDVLLNFDPSLANAKGAHLGNYPGWEAADGTNGGFGRPMGVAAAANHVVIIESLLALDPSLARERGAKTAPPISWACSAGSVESFDVLLAAAPELANCNGWEDKSNLHLAVERIGNMYMAGQRKYGRRGSELPLELDDSASGCLEIIDRLLALDHAFAATSCDFMRGLRPVDFDRLQLPCAPTLRLLDLIVGAQAAGAVEADLSLQFELLIDDLCRLPAGLSPALATAFTADPLQTVHLVARLVPQCVRMAKLAAQTDELLAERITETSQRVQQAAIVAIEERVLHIFSTPRGVGALDALVLGQCKLVLGRPKLQRLLQQMWSPSRLWLSSPPTLGAHAYHLGRWCCGVLLSTALLPALALYPPLEARVHHMATEAREVVETRIEAIKVGSNTRPGAWAPLMQGFNGFGHVDGKVYTTRQQYDAALEPYLIAVDPRAWLPIVEPAGKFMFAAASRLVLAARLSFYPVGGDAYDVPFLLVWSAALAVEEMTQFGEGGVAVWLTEPLNVTEGVAYLLFLLGLSQCVTGPAGAAEGVCTDPIMVMSISVGAGLLTLSQGLRILYRVPALGPLTLMIFQMVAGGATHPTLTSPGVRSSAPATHASVLCVCAPQVADMTSIILVYVPIVAAFSLAFLVLFRLQASPPEQAPLYQEASAGAVASLVGNEEACELFELGSEGGRLTHAAGIVVQLFEIMLGSDNLLLCLHHSAYPTLAPALMNVYVLTSSVLLMNMLSACRALDPQTPGPCRASILLAGCSPGGSRIVTRAHSRDDGQVVRHDLGEVGPQLPVHHRQGHPRLPPLAPRAAAAQHPLPALPRNLVDGSTAREPPRPAGRRPPPLLTVRGARRLLPPS